VLGITGTHALIASLVCLGVASILALPLVPASLVAVYRSLCSRSAARAGEAR